MENNVVNEVMEEVREENKNRAAKLNEKMIDDILMMSKAGMTGHRIAEIFGLASSTVTTCIKVFKAAEVKDMDVLRNKQFKYEGMVKAACARYGIDEKELIIQPVPTAPVVTLPTDEKHSDELMVLAAIRDALIQQNDLLTQFMDTVIPHWVKYIKDDVDANSDNIYQLLEKIKFNTGKK